ncbi:hypothetical protein SISNIDRAFT_403326 [Sistotremastrum niveocremeum HHB9708]|uniref:T-cell immunomodulatory protein TIP C2 domain-containing protein n=1 Tax=Sistotremastrum niveocremeum HHB9708 TaxID=1314777 RepID=A0A165ADT1_9AGAM|nr:hypothetical protein SISNIDRAFT_403326 [Sistotremastrum niveocremeum HHB9708]
MRNNWAILPLSTLLLLSHILGSAEAIWPFPSKRVKGNAFENAGSLGLDVNGRPLAYGDFNGGQFVDIVMLASDQQTIEIYQWDHDGFKFSKSTQLHHDSPVHNVIPGDYDHDGRLDLLVMNQDTGRGRTALSIYLGSPNGVFEPTRITPPPATLAQPIPLDSGGNMLVDLLGVPYEASSTLKLWKNQINGSTVPAELFELVDAPLSGGIPCIPDNPHSNALVDLDGDCIADLFLLCQPETMFGPQSFQFWINNKTSGFKISASGDLPRNIGQITFADMDRDGTMDMVYPTCSSIDRDTGVGSDCFINIVFNRQKPLCVGDASPPSCRAPDDLCSSDPYFFFNFESSDPEEFMRVPLSPVISTRKKSGLLMYDTSFSPPIPLPLRLGDADLDGFPDILLIATGEPHGGILGIGQKEDHTPKLLLSVPCGPGLPGCAAKGKGGNKRSFHVSSGSEVLDSITDASGVSFFDLDEDGTLDILIQRTGDQGSGRVEFVENNFFHDAFFLKAITLNGACSNGFCKSVNGSVNTNPFGVSYTGATYKYTVFDTVGKRSAAQAAQTPQTAYQSLLTPYAFIGLGRTNNYVEKFYVGATLHTEEHYTYLEGVIPNSKVAIWPPNVRDGQIQGDWKRELYLRPGQWIPLVTLTVVLATGLMAIIVLVLHLNEKREDKLERQRASHIINFDAL